MKIYAVKDSKAGTYGTPFFQQSDVQAARAFRAEVNRANDQNMIYLYPEEWDLVELGTYNDETGLISAGAPKLLLNGKSVQDKKDNN